MHKQSQGGGKWRLFLSKTFQTVKKGFTQNKF